MTPALQEMLSDRGPFVMPGTYTVRLGAGGRELTEHLEVRPDPADPLSPSQREARWSFIWTAWQSHLDGFEMGLQARRLRDGVRAAKMEAAEAGEQALEADLAELEGRITAIYEALWRRVRSGTSRLLGGFAGGGINYGTFEGPVEGDRERLAQIEGELEEAEEGLEEVRTARLPGLNARLRDAGLDEIRPVPGR